MKQVLKVRHVIWREGGEKRGRKIETGDLSDVAELRLPASHVIRQVGWDSSTHRQNNIS